MLIIKKRFLSAVAAVLLISCFPGNSYADAAPGVSAESAIVMHSGGEVVFAKNADTQMLIASTTKLMTAIVAMEELKLDEEVLIRAEHCAVEGSSMYLKAGETRTVRELLTGLLLVSGNDAALALSDHVAGGSEAFVEMMNVKAKSLGMDNTHYTNPHGLNAEEHYSTARDLALLMDHCMKNRSFAELAGMKSCEIDGQTLINHNKLLLICPGCIGGKTGYTKRAGRCLVSCCERAGTRFICVTLCAPEDWDDHCRLYDWAFNAYSDRDISSELGFAVPVVSGESDSVRIRPERLTVFVPTDKELSVRAELPFFVFAPVEKGEIAGDFKAFLDGRQIAQGKLLYDESVALETE